MLWLQTCFFLRPREVAVSVLGDLPCLPAAFCLVMLAVHLLAASVFRLPWRQLYCSTTLHAQEGCVMHRTMTLENASL